MARRNDHSREELREMALAAAERIVVQEGAAALTTRKIAGEIGYTVGSLYLVFANLDDLVLQLNLRTLADLAQDMDSAVEAVASPAGNVAALGRTYIRFATRNPGRWRLLFERGQHDMADVLPEAYRSQVRALFDRVEIQLTRLDPQRAPDELRLAAWALWSGVHGVCTLAMGGSLAVAGAEDAEKLAQALIVPFLAGWASARAHRTVN